MRVRVYATLRPIVGGAQPAVETQPGQTVRELVDEMVGRWPDLRAEMLDEDGNLLRRISIMLNGRNIIYLDRLDTVIPDGANIDIFPPVGGG
ncbi:MAG: MoaD/ThiS family protein [Caldilineae bacterium]|nr:MoaD/ThiS family protein [Anaerolineae bacterium]MCB0205862.1 MoaD/ThiS family protein [Anaerolineae bacterium]MCB9152921.1 MoaD/ThiS family protein [Caldilineae bacterium]